MNRTISSGMQLLTLLLLLALALPVMASTLTEAEVSNNLMCNACPKDQLAICNCGSAQEMKNTIHRMIGEGKSKQQILDYFVARYGESIVSTPPRKGFALTAYVAPYVGLAAGAAIALFMVMRWARRSNQETGPPTDATADAGAPPLDEAARERVAQELARLDKEE